MTAASVSGTRAMIRSLLIGVLAFAATALLLAQGGATIG